MAFPILAVLSAVASDMQSRSEEEDALRQAGANTRRRIMQTRAQELGGSPYPMMGQDLRNQLSEIRQEADRSRNNNIGAILQAYLKQGNDSPRMIGENKDIPTVDDLGAGNRSGLSMVDGLFGNESTDLGEKSFTRPALSDGSRGLGMVDSLFGDDEDPWGPGVF